MQFSPGAIPAVEAGGGGAADIAHRSPSERAYGDGAAAQHVAAAGVAGKGKPLPFADRIARSLGPENAKLLDGVEVHVGGAAAGSTAELGAEAYAQGNHIAFAKEPDLHLAAEEAVHVVQQKQGITPAGGVGAEGDGHEEQARAVADRVVAGEPAADLLPAPKTAAPAAGLQFRPDRRPQLPKGEEGFQQMWDAHPHNYQEDPSQNIDSPELLDEHGLPQSYANTCAIRISIMLNEIGHRITPDKTKAAGLARRPHYSPKTKQYYILAAAEIKQYLTNTYRAPDVTYPARGRFKDGEEFDQAFESTIKPALAGKRGICVMDKIFGYGGTGHVDLFDGEALSNAASFYPCQQLQLWYI